MMDLYILHVKYGFDLGQISGPIRVLPPLQHYLQDILEFMLGET